MEDTEARQEFTDPRSGVSNGIVRGLGDWRRGGEAPEHCENVNSGEGE